MKVLVINNSGNVGKSTLCRHLIAPRLPNAVIKAVESINSNEFGEKTRADKFLGIMEEVMLADHAIVDVGQSQAETFMNRMDQQAGAQEDFDFIVVPVVSNEKEQEDTITTLNLLPPLGVPAEKIRIIFNMVPPTNEVEDDFGTIFREVPSIYKKGKIKLNPLARVDLNEYFDVFKQSGLTVEGLTNDTTDYRALLKAEKDPEARKTIVQMIQLKNLHKTVTEKLDRVFEEVFA